MRPVRDDTLLFDPASLSWSRPHSDGPPAAAPGVMVDHDAASGKVYLHDSSAAFYSFDPATNSYQQLKDDAGVDYHMTGRIDPSRELFVMMGGGQIRAISLAGGSNHDVMDWDSSTTGCEGLQNARSPGLAYDPDQDRLVGWAGGEDVYLFDATAKTCTKKTFPGGPGAAQDNGTFGRFRYFPKLKVFAVVNDAEQDAYTLRMIP